MGQGHRGGYLRVMVYRGSPFISHPTHTAARKQSKISKMMVYFDSSSDVDRDGPALHRHSSSHSHFRNRNRSPTLVLTSTSIPLPAIQSNIMLLGNPPSTSTHCFISRSSVPSGTVKPFARATAATSCMRERERVCPCGWDEERNRLVRSWVAVVTEFLVGGGGGRWCALVDGGGGICRAAGGLDGRDVPACVPTTSTTNTNTNRRPSMNQSALAFLLPLSLL